MGIKELNQMRFIGIIVYLSTKIQPNALYWDHYHYFNSDYNKYEWKWEEWE